MKRCKEGALEYSDNSLESTDTPAPRQSESAISTSLLPLVTAESTWTSYCDALSPSLAHDICKLSMHGELRAGEVLTPHQPSDSSRIHVCCAAIVR
jgi:hypothetical protein